MKSYVENAYIDNQYRLICHYNGISISELKRLALKNNIVAYELPKAQSLECVWNFRLHFSGREVLIFSSKCTSVGGWDEVGSLSINFKKDDADSSSDVFIKESMENFYVADYSMLVYEEDDVYSESGICFVDGAGAELIVVVAPSPGAVSVSIPSVNKEVNPEFSMSDYKRKAAVKA